MKNKRNVMVLITAICISIIILALTIMFMFFNKDEFSENENRYLEKFPKFTFQALKEGEYIEKLENYLSDHFPFRDNFMGFKTNVYKMIGQNKINNIYLGQEEFMLEEYNVTPETTTIPIKTLNSFKDKLPNDVDVKMMLVPTSVEIYRDYLPNYATNKSQKDVIDYVYNNINFKGIDVYKALNLLKDVDRLYFKTDHHWNTFGAYIGYVEFLRANNKENADSKDGKNHKSNEYNIGNIEFEKITDNFYGTFYSKTNDYSVTSETMYKIKDTNNYTVKNIATGKVSNTLYEPEWLDKKDKYSYFLGTNQPILEITNNSIDNNDEIVIIKDSYANILIPFIARDYKKVHVIDPRYFRTPISEYITEKNIKEVLLVYNVKTIETDLGVGVIN